MPSHGVQDGARKCGWSTGSRRSTSTAMLTMVNTPSSSSAVVPPSSVMSTVITRMSAMTLVKMIETHGVRRPGCTRPKIAGSIRSLDIP